MTAKQAEPPEQPCRCKPLMRKGNPLRSFWYFIITVLLFYYGTVFIYRLCFVEFQISSADFTPAETSGSWVDFDKVVDAIFLIDLFFYFFATYDDEEGHEVTDLHRIAAHYLRSWSFFVNILGCVPTEVTELLLDSAFNNDSAGNANKGVRILRLQRLSKMTRTLQLARLSKFRNIQQMSNFRWWQWIQGMRGIRVINLCTALCWIVHILSCAWYLCAVLHQDAEDTWVFRHKVGANAEIRVVQLAPFDQWMQAWYFVFLGVFQGDMFATTNGEIVLACIIMMVGAVFQSILINEVIVIITSVDQKDAYLATWHQLANEFAKHAWLDRDSQDRLGDWVRSSAGSGITRECCEGMQELMVGKHMPPQLLEDLTNKFFQGKLIQHHFLKLCTDFHVMPPLLPPLLALAVRETKFTAGEVVYEDGDLAVSIFLILSGTFAYVAKFEALGNIRDNAPARKGFEIDVRASASDSLGTKKLSDDTRSIYALMGSKAYFGDIELCKNIPRRATVRCESKGCVLELGRQDFKKLSEEFPTAGLCWARAATRRESSWRRRRGRLLQQMDRVTFAAAVIQTFYRKRRRGPAGTAGLTSVSAESAVPSVAIANASKEPWEAVVKLRKQAESMRQAIGEMLRQQEALEGSLDQFAGTCQKKFTEL